MASRRGSCGAGLDCVRGTAARTEVASRTDARNDLTNDAGNSIAVATVLSLNASGDVFPLHPLRVSLQGNKLPYMESTNGDPHRLGAL